MIRRPPRATRTDTLFPYTTPFRSARPRGHAGRRHGRTMPYPPTRGAGQHPRSAPARLRSKDIMNPDRTLTKAELAELLFDRVGLNKRPEERREGTEGGSTCRSGWSQVN